MYIDFQPTKRHLKNQSKILLLFTVKYPLFKKRKKPTDVVSTGFYWLTELPLTRTILNNRR